MALVQLNLKLHIVKREDIQDLSQRHRFCFAVVDLDKSESYPSNYVCILPANIGKSMKPSGFEELFGEKSTEQAKVILTEALKSLEDPDIRCEVERRMELLEPKDVSQLKCCSCGKLFSPRSAKKFRKNYCENCAKKKFGIRAQPNY